MNVKELKEYLNALPEELDDLHVAARMVAPAPEGRIKFSIADGILVAEKVLVMVPDPKGKETYIDSLLSPSQEHLELTQMASKVESVLGEEKHTYLAKKIY